MHLIEMASNSSTSSFSKKSTDSIKKGSSNAQKSFKGDNDFAQCPFKLLWSFGMNTEVPLINLTTKNRTIIAYACSHAVIIYNYKSKEAITLQAHQGTVRTLSISRDGKWLLSADFDSDPVVVIWDTESGVPICTLFNPHGNDELAAARISPNAKYIVTIGNEKHQKVQFWLWTYGKDEPNTSIELTEIAFDRVKEIAFNEDFPEEFALTADHNIVFFIWAQGKLKYNCPKVVGNVRRYGIFNSSCYVSGTQQAMTATANGYVLVWTTVLEKGRGNDRDVEMKYIKSIQLHKNSINVILQHDGMLVTGTADGRINFHDPQLKILYWCQNRHLDSIQSISFNLQSTLLGPVSTTIASDLECDEVDLNYKGEFEENSESKIESTICDERIEYLKRVESKLMQHQDEVTSTTTINLEYMLRDYDKMGSSAKPPHIPVDATSENAPFYVDNFFVGDELACGLENGTLWLLHPITLEPLDEIPYKHSTESIVKLTFTECAEYMAYYDNTLVVAVFKRNHDSLAGSYLWNFIGKYRTHYTTIRDILFGPATPTSIVPRLFSLGEDKALIEYDLKNSGPYPHPGLKIMETHQIEYTATPLCFSWYPESGIERFFVISNSEYKYRLLNDATKMIRGTFLGPVFDAPVRHFKVLPDRKLENNRYMVFATNKEIGLQILPFDGNPYKTVGMIGHPYKITNICINCNGTILFTSGYNDPCVLMWKIKCRSVNILANLGGKSLSPYYGLIEGGRNGWLISEMKDLFYYAQILHQGENTTATRIVSEKVAIKQIPNLLRAIGYYPSNKEIEILMGEISYKNYAETGKLVEEITFEEFVKLYINHRPAFGISLKQLQEAFQVFTIPNRTSFLDQENPVLTKEQFMNILFGKGPTDRPDETNESFGEPLTYKEAYIYLKFLIDSDSDEMSYLDNDKPSILDDFIFLPERISYKDFVTDIMGIELPEETRADDE
ncbi:cilia- and flagella-associated protein 251 [Colletes latitarsis]|uniref:cilia- and flagella-associated protein 251 n=1 Tax=Colletes latitarsis TaxID=2605962 RepID=UPI004035E88D